MAKKREEWLGADPVKMNDEDFAKIQSNSDAWNAARERGDQAAMDALHDDSERIRAKYGYSGGDAGIEYNKLPEGESGYKFSSNENRPSAYTPQYAKELESLTQEAAPAFESRYDGQMLALTERQTPAYESRYDGELAALGGREAPAYRSRYGAELEERTRALLDREPFSYDPEADPLYAAYRKEYAREGRRAAENTLGSYAAMTGGMPSTAAVAASQQAGDYYAAKAADAMPELYRLAYQMYQDEGSRQVRDINALRQLENTDYARYVNDVNRFNSDRSFDYALLNQLENNDYSRYLTELNQQNADRAFDYAVLNQLDQNDRSDYRTALNQWDVDRSFRAGVYNQLESDAYRSNQAALGQWNTDRAFEYGQERDALSDSRYEDELAYGRALTEDELAYQRERDALSDAMSRARLGAAYGDFSGLSELGVTPDAQALLQMELAGSGRTVPVGGGRSGGTGGTGGTGGGTSGAAAQRSVTAYDRGSLDYDPDEGIFTWNGKKYSDPQKLRRSLNASNLTDEQERSIRRALRAYGVDPDS